MVSAALFIGMFAFMLLSVPIGMAIGLASIAGILAGATPSLAFIAQTLVTGVDSFPIMAIPMFILAGDLMGSGGVSRRLLNVANMFFGRVYGGLAIVTVVVCMFFAAISGSGPATVAAIGTMVVPTMVKKGYSKSFSLAVVACAGCIGVIIPPSIPMVLFGVATGTSVTGMFMAGFLPGILIGSTLIAYCYFYSKKQGWKDHEMQAFSWGETGKAVWDAKWALVSPVIILGGIYGGFFTPTEAAAVSAVYAFICGAFFHRELGWKVLKESVARSCVTTAATMAILGAATAFARLLTLEQVPMMLAEFMVSLTDNAIIIMLLMNVFLIIVGMLMDTVPAILILAPILAPVAAQFGLNPVHFGLIMVVNLAIGFVTPPVGINLFVASRIGDERLESVVAKALPMVLLLMICLLLITYIPAISMTLPNLLL